MGQADVCGNKALRGGLELTPAMQMEPKLMDALDRKARLVLRQACDNALRIATAESCTGGLLASVLTDVPGCSHAFDRGFVVYTDEAKREILGVDDALLRAFGAVSDEAARAMAEGGLRNARADLCAAVTGYADDPDGEVEAGLVYLAVAARGRATASVRMQFGDMGRTRVRECAVDTALTMLDDAVRALGAD